MCPESADHSLRLEYTLSPEAGLAERLAVVSDGNGAVVDFLRSRSRLGDDDIFVFNLAYEELVSNIARHAVRFGGDPVRVFAELAVDGRGVSLVVGDDGPPFNPLTAAVKAAGVHGGQGLRLIRAYIPDGWYRYDNGRNLTGLFRENPGAAPEGGEGDRSASGNGG